MVVKLDDTIKNLEIPEILPHELPIVHMSVARWFSIICKQGYLKPHECQVFNRALLYFFYGGAFYRSENKPTQDATQLPIAFMFDPNLLNQVTRYFPFDTGAAEKEKYGSSWSDKLKNFDRYSVNGGAKTPCRLVYHLYESNTDYLKGNYSLKLRSQPEPLSELYEFLDTDLTPECDHRKSIIECQIEQQIDLDKNLLLWIGFPEGLTNDFVDLLNSFLNITVPECYPYPSHKIFIPSEIEKQLEVEASKIVRRRYINLFE